MQPSACVNATIGLFGPNDSCSTASQQFSNNISDIDNINDIDGYTYPLFMNDCPSRYSAYVNACLPNVSTI